MFLVSAVVSCGFVRLPDKGVGNATVIGVWEINLRPTSHGFPLGVWDPDLVRDQSDITGCAVAEQPESREGGKSARLANRPHGDQGPCFWGQQS